jgi:hypothetical protein
MNILTHASNVAMDGADCAHPRTRVEKLPPGQFHFGRVVCADCGKQLCWQPKPENSERRRRNVANIKKLLGISQLLDWERAFCQGLSQHKLPSPKQQALLSRLTEKYLNKENIQNAEPKRSCAPLHECAA